MVAKKAKNKGKLALPSGMTAPVVTAEELDIANKKLADVAELKRQHSHLTSHLKALGVKKDFEKCDIKAKKAYFRGFVANRLKTMAAKALEVEHHQRNRSTKEQGWGWMTEERMGKKNGENWAAQTLLEHEAGKNVLELQDPNETNRWKKQYKIYHERCN